MATYLNDLLPLPKKNSYSLKPKSGVIKSQMQSGIARQRLISTVAPTIVSLKWSFTHSEFTVFQSWVQYDAKNGAEWFDITLLTGLGMVNHKARFTDSEGVYNASLNEVANKWDVIANVEVIEQPILSIGSYALIKQYNLQDILSTQTIITNSINTFFSKL